MISFGALKAAIYWTGLEDPRVALPRRELLQCGVSTLHGQVLIEVDYIYVIVLFHEVIAGITVRELLQRFLWLWGTAATPHLDPQQIQETSFQVEHPFRLQDVVVYHGSGSMARDARIGDLKSEMKNEIV